MLLLMEIIISIEQFLKFRFSQQQTIFFYQLCLLLILYSYLLILIEVTLFHYRYKWRLYIFGPQFLPIKPSKPRMVFYLIYSIGSQPILRFPSYKLIYEIHCFIAPILGDFALSQLYLFREHQISNLIPRTTIVGSLSY